jgi:hypothetical protein
MTNRRQTAIVSLNCETVVSSCVQILKCYVINVMDVDGFASMETSVCSRQWDRRQWDTLKKRIQVFVYSIRYSCPMLSKTELCRINSHENPSVYSGVVSHGHACRHYEAKRWFSKFFLKRLQTIKWMSHHFEDRECIVSSCYRNL